MISVFSILIFWVMDFSFRLEGEENAAGHERNVFFLGWFSIPTAWLASPQRGCWREAGGRAGGRGSNRWPFAPGAFHAVCSASGGVSANLHSLACFKEKFTAEGMSASTRGCRELEELWFQAVFL